jgi:hypothetical protein
MSREIVRRAEAVPAVSMITLALGAAAFGAIAVGAIAIGALAIGRVEVKKARFRTLEVDELTVRRLRVLEPQAGAGAFSEPAVVPQPHVQRPADGRDDAQH